MSLILLLILDKVNNASCKLKLRPFCKMFQKYNDECSTYKETKLSNIQKHSRKRKANIKIVNDF